MPTRHQYEGAVGTIKYYDKPPPCGRLPASKSNHQSERKLMEPQWLSKAPVVEALVDIRTEHAQPLTQADLLKFESAIKAQYPERRAKIKFTALVTGNGKSVNTDSSSIEGYYYRRTDKTQVVQARLDGFSFSRLQPYIPWAEWTVDAKAMWRIFKDITAPTAITGISVRTLNVMELPIGTDMKKFIHIYPEVMEGSGLPQKIGGFTMHVVLPHEESQSLIIMNQTAPATTDQTATHLSLSLDIDVQRGNQGALTDEELWHQMDELRQVKNNFFFNLLSGSTLAGYA